MTPSTPAQRAAEKLARAGELENVTSTASRAPGHYSKQVLELVASIIEAEYSAERRECVRVMKMAVQNADTDPHYLTIETVKLLRELIGKME